MCPIPDICGNNTEKILKAMEITYLISRTLINSELAIYFLDITRYKYIWAERGAFSIIDYIIANQKMINIVLDTRVFRGRDVHTNHLLISKTNLLRK